MDVEQLSRVYLRFLSHLELMQESSFVPEMGSTDAKVAVEHELFSQEETSSVQGRQSLRMLSGGRSLWWR